MKKILKVLMVVGILLAGGNNLAHADPQSVNLTVRDGATIVFSGAVTLPTTITSLNDATNTPHTINSSSVLSVLDSAATGTGSNFSISNLTYFSSFDSLYLKCITDPSGEKCDNWQYAVNGSGPSVGMDKNILAGGENVYVYFGPQNKITLSSGNIKTTDTLTVTTQNYDYVNNAWITRAGVTVGLTQPDPSNPSTPTEVKTSPVDANGQATFSSIPAGNYNVGVKEDYYFPTEALTVATPPPTSSGGGGGGGGYVASAGKVLGVTTTKTGFDLKLASDFLVAQQKPDGSFGEDLYTDWAGMALASGNYQNQVIKLIKHFEESPIAGTNLTDYERHAMALMALGLNPYDTNGTNYIKKIADSFDGKQFGDPTQNNDDIFALIVLQNAGYGQDEKMITDDVSFILSTQKQDGSWDESIDMTGAGIEALSAFNKSDQVKSSLTKAEAFLKQTEESNGGWGDNASSTAWAIEGILALGEKPEDWKKNDPTNPGVSNTPLDYLATMQDTDGGIKDANIQTKIWETTYVISALSGKTWNQTMQTFDKPKDVSNVPGASPEIKPATKPVVMLKKITPITSKTTIHEITLPETQNPPALIPKPENWFSRLIHFIF
ncbi:MAG: terpene cyclase/mutase family protein [Patescibacteria group bacterium]|nr:terpene cyclase/mutase family protein [Patescibacteria group bacterium]